MTDNRPHREPEDGWVRELLEDAVSDVSPRHGLDAIRERTVRSTRTGRRAWLWGAGTAVLATAATVAAVVTLSGGPGTTRVDGSGFASSGTAPSTISSNGAVSPPPATSSSQPGTESPAPSESPAATGAPAGTAPSVAVYYLGQTPQGSRLFVEPHPVTTGDPALVAVRDAVSGRPADPDYTNPWPDGTGVTAVTAGSGAITVSLQSSTSLAQPLPGMDADTAKVTVQQLVYTAQDALSSHDPVRFEVNGQPVDRLLGQPVPASGVSRPDDPFVAQSPVTVSWPAQGAEVPGTFAVRGEANSFEGNLLWQVLDQHGKQVASGHTPAGAYTIDPYSFTVKDLAPGHYTLVVHNDDPSGKNHFTKDTKDITVR